MKNKRGIPQGWHSEDVEKMEREITRAEHEQALEEWRDLKNHWTVTRIVNGRNIDDGNKPNT